MNIRNYFLLSLIMTIFSLSELSATPHEVWYNAYSGITISTEYHTNGMYVRGLYSKNTTSWFKRKSSTTFRDSRGNIIVISSDNLIFTDRKRRSKLTFVTLTAYRNKRAVNSQSLSNNPRIDSERINSTLSSNEVSGINSTAENQEKLELVKEHSSTLNSLISLEGTWSVQNLDKKVYITETRDGIKARFTDSMNWISYERISGTSDYINQEGEKYTLNQNNLIWHYKDGQKIFILTKMANDLVK